MPPATNAATDATSRAERTRGGGGGGGGGNTSDASFDASYNDAATSATSAVAAVAEVVPGAGVGDTAAVSPSKSLVTGPSHGDDNFAVPGVARAKLAAASAATAGNCAVAPAAEPQELADGKELADSLRRDSRGMDEDGDTAFSADVVGDGEGAAEAAGPLVQAFDEVVRAVSTPELIRKWDYPEEEHKVKTSDGVVLTLHRIPDSRFGTTRFMDTGPCERPGVLLWHGLGNASNVWVCCPEGPPHNLAFALADAGYDVWLANSRGTVYASADGSSGVGGSGNGDGGDDGYWSRAGFDEIAQRDVPAVVGYVLRTTGRPQMAYVGFSQGAAAGLAALSVVEELAPKISCFVGLAPPVNPPAPSGVAFQLLLRTLGANGLRGLLGEGPFLDFARRLRFYTGADVHGLIMDCAFKALFDWEFDKKIGGRRRKAALYCHVFSGVGARAVSNLFVGKKDSFTSLDQIRLHLPTSADVVEIPDYTHLDMLWALDCPQTLWPRVFAALDRSRHPVAAETAPGATDVDDVDKDVSDHDSEVSSLPSRSPPQQSPSASSGTKAPKTVRFAAAAAATAAANHGRDADGAAGDSDDDYESEYSDDDGDDGGWW
ncbi:cholesterol esterase [Cladochytrium tenue]|nr:cholesterol esterase [Cladochytrium tenue]